VPQGLEFKLNENDPIVAQYRNFALESGLDQTQFTKGVDLIAALRLSEAQKFAEAQKAEVTKLGAAAHARVDAVKGWLGAMAGDKAADLVRVLETWPIAATVEALENMMQKYGTHGAANFSGQRPRIH
jgi:hypothetical protein